MAPIPIEVETAIKEKSQYPNASNVARKQRYQDRGYKAVPPQSQNKRNRSHVNTTDIFLKTFVGSDPVDLKDVFVYI